MQEEEEVRFSLASGASPFPSAPSASGAEPPSLAARRRLQERLGNGEGGPGLGAGGAKRGGGLHSGQGQVCAHLPDDRWLTREGGGQPAREGLFPPAPLFSKAPWASAGVRPL